MDIHGTNLELKSKLKSLRQTCSPAHMETPTAVLWPSEAADLFVVKTPLGNWKFEMIIFLGVRQKSNTQMTNCSTSFMTSYTGIVFLPVFPYSKLNY